jgi:hypothetical protein
VRSTLTDRIFLLPAVGEGNSIGLSSPFGLGFFFAEHVNEPAVASGDTAEPVNEPANAPGNTAEPVNGPAATPGNTAEPVNEPAAAPGNTAEPVNEPANAPGNTAELGLGLFFAASVSAPPNENSTIAQHTTFILDLRMAASFLSFTFAFYFWLGYEGVTSFQAFSSMRPGEPFV